MTSACMEIPLRPAFPVMTCMQWYLVSRISQIHGVPRLAGKKVKSPIIMSHPVIMSASTAPFTHRQDSVVGYVHSLLNWQAAT